MRGKDENEEKEISVLVLSIVSVVGLITYSDTMEENPPLIQSGREMETNSENAAVYQGRVLIKNTIEV